MVREGGKKNIELANIQYVSGPDNTKVIINLTGKPEYRISSTVNPPEMRISFTGVNLSPEVKGALAVNDGRVNEIKTSRSGKNAVFLTISMVPSLGYKASFYRNETFAIVIDIRQEKAIEEEAGIKGKAPAKEEEKEEAGRRWADLIHLGGYAKNETAYRISSPDRFTKIRNIFFLSGTGKISDSVSYRASGRAVYDAVYSLTDNYPKSVRDDQKYDPGIRDFFVDVSKGDWDLRLGSQQIVWGEAVGLFFADVVNAKDLREFVLPDFDYIRIPDWAADIEYTKDRFHLELVWIPILKFNKLGLPDSEFPQALPLPSGVSASATGESKPSSSLHNSEAGVRLSYLLSGWDFSLFHMYAWDKFPTVVREVITPVFYTFHPEHRRINISGLTVAKEIDDIVLRGEFVYYRGKYFSVVDPNDSDGLVKKDYLDYLLGISYTFLGKLDANVQFMQRIIFDYDPRIFREDRVRSSVSLWLKTGFLDNTIEPELLFISSLRERDVMIRPMMNFRYGGHWQFKAGVDIFDGVPDGAFGQFRKKNRVYGEAKYSF
ncbi:MAG: AMIN domain-containing protein [Deltaproteobacteria bacterium]|nr:AMIN domain-containing protein [Deltaproteobacteria bacterium]